MESGKIAYGALIDSLFDFSITSSLLVYFIYGDKNLYGTLFRRGFKMSLIPLS